MGWIFSGIVILISAIAFLWYRHRVQGELDRIISSHGSVVARLKKDETSRLDRLTRESDSQKGDKVYALVEALASPLDALDEAIQFADSEMEEGLVGLRKSFDQAFGRQNIERVEPEAGDTFFPELHEAISAEVSDEIAKGKIVKCLRSGWKSDDRTLRPALVSVSSGTGLTD